jgi:hypothetical protein
MIEFDETLSQRYNGKEAVMRRIETRIKHTTHDIPYYQRGLDVSEFVYGSQVAAIKLAFKDFGPNIKFDGVNSRIQFYDVNIDVNVGEE